VKLTVTSASYQSLPFGLRSRAALMVGFVWSMFTVAVSLAELPALSKAAPTTVWLAPSLESVVGSLQLAMPESASAQWKLTSTGVLFQLSALGGACVADRRRCPVDADGRGVVRLHVPGHVDAPELERARLARDRNCRPAQRPSSTEEVS
jgi:hypothetical protein